MSLNESRKAASDNIPPIGAAAKLMLPPPRWTELDADCTIEWIAFRDDTDGFCTAQQFLHVDRPADIMTPFETRWYMQAEHRRLRSDGSIWNPIISQFQLAWEFSHDPDDCPNAEWQDYVRWLERRSSQGWAKAAIELPPVCEDPRTRDEFVRQFASDIMDYPRLYARYIAARETLRQAVTAGSIRMWAKPHDPSDPFKLRPRPGAERRLVSTAEMRGPGGGFWLGSAFGQSLAPAARGKWTGGHFTDIEFDRAEVLQRWPDPETETAKLPMAA